MRQRCESWRVGLLFVVALGCGVACAQAGYTWRWQIPASVTNPMTVAAAGDVDGNGAPDFLFWEAADGGLGTPTGKVLLFLGHCDGTFSDGPMWTAVGPPLVSGDSGDFGYHMGGADLDGDGYSDIVVLQRLWEQAPCKALAEAGTGDPDIYCDYCNQGRIYVWLSNGHPLVQLTDAPQVVLSDTASWTFASDPLAQPGEVASFALGDADDDGYDDLLIGEAGWTPGQTHCIQNSCADGPDGRGRVLVFNGGPSFSTTPSRTYEGDVLCTGDSCPGDNCSSVGMNVAVLGDVDGHGGTDIAIDDGARRDGYQDPMTGYSDRAGLIRIYDHSGGSQPTHKIWGRGRCDLYPDCYDLMEFSGTNDYSLTSSIGPGDLNGDGLADLVTNGFGPGGWGGDDYKPFSFHGPLSGSQRPAWELGGGCVRAPVAAGDVDGDGYADVVRVTCAGEAQLYLGSSSGLRQAPSEILPDLPQPCSSNVQADTWSVAGLGDVNGDGADDLVMLTGRPCHVVPDPSMYWIYVYTERPQDYIPSGICKEAQCHDGLDNDGDTLIDCADPDCKGHTGCPIHEGNCHNLIDDDGDTAVDCADTDCHGMPGCGGAETDCTNGSDDNGNTLADCYDPDCALDPACKSPPDEQTPANNDPNRDNCNHAQGQTFYSHQDVPPDDAAGFPEACNVSVNQGQDVAGDGRSADQEVLGQSGQEELAVTDLFIKGRDSVTDVKIERTHLTRIYDADSPFGPAWHLNYRQTIEEQPGGSLKVMSGARTDTFMLEPGSTDSWVGTEGRYERIVVGTGGGSFVMRTRGGTTATFTSVGSPGSRKAILNALSSSNGNSLTFSYSSFGLTDPTKWQLSYVADAFGPALQFMYLDPSHPSLVSAIVDPDGREVDYTYDSSGLLTSAKVSARPSATAGSPLPRIVCYNYWQDFPTPQLQAQLQDALQSVVYPNESATLQWTGKPRLAWSYNTNAASTQPLAWVLEHDIGDPTSPEGDAVGGTYKFGYTVQSGITDANEPKVDTLVHDRRDTITEFSLNRIGNVLAKTVQTHGLRMQTGPLAGSFQSSFSYNDDGDLTQFKKPLGFASIRTHAGSDHPRAAQANELVSLGTPDARGADQLLIQAKTTYEPIFQKPYQTTDPRGADLGQPAAYTTTYTYDYMENLPAAVTHFAPLLGLTESQLWALFAEIGMTPTSPVATPPQDLNGDGITTQQAGNLIRIEYPQVTQPTSQSAQETFSYNDSGQLLRHVDAERNVTTYEYYPPTALDGNASSPHGTGGYLRKVVRDASADSTRDGGTNPAPVMQTMSFEYSNQVLDGETFPGNLRGIPTAIIDARGVKTLFKINEADETLKIVQAATAPSGLVAFKYVETRTYDLNGNVTDVEVDDKGGLDGDDVPVRTHFEYDLLNQVKRRVDDDGHSSIVTTYKYDRSGNLTERTRAVGTPDEQKETWTWDERDLPVTYTRGANSVADAATVTYEVDENGNITRTIDAENGDVTQFIYDGFDRLVQVVNREGERLVLKHDAAGNVISREWHGPSDENRTDGVDDDVLLAQEDSSFDERERPYRTDEHLFFVPNRAVGSLHDSDGTVDNKLSTISQRDRLGRIVSATDTSGGVTTFAYDGLSRLLKVTDPLNDVLQRVYDANGNMTQVQSIQKASEAGLLASPETFTSSASFDSLNRCTSALEPNGQATTFQYDSRGNLTKTHDQLGNETERRYDRLGRLTDERAYLSVGGTGANSTNPDTAQGGGDGVIKHLLTWDACSRLRTKRDDNGNASTYTYDTLDRMRRLDYADGTFETWDYNHDSELQIHVRQDGSIESWQHDKEGRPTRVDVSTPLPGTTARTWGYDGLGRVTKSFDDNGTADDVTTRTFYDSLGRVIREEQAIPGFPTVNLDSEWTGTARLLNQTYPNGRVVARQYDGLGHVSEIDEGTGGAFIAKYRYVGPDRLLRLTYPSGVQVDERDPVSGSTISGAYAGYDSNGREIRRTWKDSLGNPVFVWLTGYNGPGGIGTNRKVNEQRTSLIPGTGGTGPSHLDTYQLDSAYRQLSFLRNGTVASTRSLDGDNKMYAFLDEGTPHNLVVDGVPADAGMNQYSSMDGVARTYAASGGLVNDGTQGYAYDESDRLVTVSNATTHVHLADSVYDADGRRVILREGSTTTRFIWSGWQVAEERSGSGAVQRQYVEGRGLDDHVQMRNVATGLSYYYLSNSLGNVGMLTSAAGAPLESYEYSWLGRPKIYDASHPTGNLTSSPLGNPYLWQGARWDVTTGLYDFRHRSYSPKVGEFLTLDPLGLWAHGVGNGYDAFGANGWGNRDPLGLLEGPAVEVEPLDWTKIIPAPPAAASGSALLPGAVVGVTFAATALAATDEWLAFDLWQQSDENDIAAMAQPSPRWGPRSPMPVTNEEVQDFIANRPNWRAEARKWWGWGVDPEEDSSESTSGPPDASGSGGLQGPPRSDCATRLGDFDLPSLRKADARAIANAMGLPEAQARAVLRAIARATATSGLQVTQNGPDVVVQVFRSGNDGFQTIESTVRLDGTKSVVQKAYDGAGNLVHFDPK